MKINQNISAVIANDQLLRNENGLAASVERLSSGLKFNNAKDNPSGMAISFKMQAQINALNRASLNATDGSSMVETIDDAIGEMTEILQRMRELCVQAANGTNTPEDLEATQKEIAALKKEIDRISSDTEFNGHKLLDGTLDRRTYVTDATVGSNTFGNSFFDKITNVIISDEVQANYYNVNIRQAPEHEVQLSNGAQAAAGPNGTVGPAQAGFVTINGVKVEIKEGMTSAEVYETLRNAGETGRVNIFAATGNVQDPVTSDCLETQGYEEKAAYNFGDTLAFVSKEYGTNKVTIEYSNEGVRDFLGLNTIQAKLGADVKVEIDDASISGNNNYTKQAVVKNEGDQVVITDKSGFKISFEVRADILTDDTTNPPAQLGNKEIRLETTDLGTLQLQIGANEDQELAVRVPILNTKSLYIDDLNVTEKDGASRGITQSDVAISIVSAARSKMGAYENRLDYAIGSLDASEENMTNAISRLGDVDMAQEMTEYTSKNVLTQAAISVLSQANDLPQQVLSLLRG